MSKKILVVDDEANVRKMLSDYLVQHHFRVETASNGREALFTADRFEPDLILLDVMMPELDGLDFMRLHREKRKTPIILLTARLEESDKVIGLELGADDYVTKPFGMRELLARIRAIFRRTTFQEEAPEIYSAADVVLDRDRRRVEIQGNEIKLTPTEFELLACLIAAPGRVYSRLQLFEKLHDVAIEGSERTIDVHIRNLRAKLEVDPAHPTRIETVFGAGYRFAED